MKNVIAIVGPTAIGKSTLAQSLAANFKIEVINADSRQIFRFMDIGTAKPGADAREIVPHYLFDIVNPDQQFSVAIYQQEAWRLIQKIRSRHGIPVLVGGTGLYVWATLEKWEIPAIAPNLDFRLLLEKKARQEGHAVLYDELKKVDPASAKRIAATNVRRIIRALEIYYESGRQVPVDKRSLRSSENRPLIIGLTMPRKNLYEIIDKRVDLMINNGLVDEVKSLFERGYGMDLPSMSGIGYREIGMYLKGENSLEDAIAQIKQRTHNLARKQYAWFKLNDSRIKWFDVEKDIKDNIEKIKMIVREYL